eukprot:Em0019g362a
MGTKCAPAYASIFMGHVEKTLQTMAGDKVLLWRWFIDDILLVYGGTREQFDQYMAEINGIHPTIMFTSECSDEQVTFLEVAVHKEPITFDEQQTTLIPKAVHKDANPPLTFVTTYNDVVPKQWDNGQQGGEIYKPVAIFSSQSTPNEIAIVSTPNALVSDHVGNQTTQGCVKRARLDVHHNSANVETMMPSLPTGPIDNPVKTCTWVDPALHQPRLTHVPLPYLSGCDDDEFVVVIQDCFNLDVPLPSLTSQPLPLTSQPLPPLTSQPFPPLTPHPGFPKVSGCDGQYIDENPVAKEADAPNDTLMNVIYFSNKDAPDEEKISGVVAVQEQMAFVESLRERSTYTEMPHTLEDIHNKQMYTKSIIITTTPHLLIQGRHQLELLEYLLLDQLSCAQTKRSVVGGAERSVVGGGRLRCSGGKAEAGLPKASRPARSDFQLGLTGRTLT